MKGIYQLAKQFAERLNNATKAGTIAGEPLASAAALKEQEDRALKAADATKKAYFRLEHPFLHWLSCLPRKIALESAYGSLLFGVVKGPALAQDYQKPAQEIQEPEEYRHKTPLEEKIWWPGKGKQDYSGIRATSRPSWEAEMAAGIGKETSLSAFFTGEHSDRDDAAIKAIENAAKYGSTIRKQTEEKTKSDSYLGCLAMPGLIIIPNSAGTGIDALGNIKTVWSYYPGPPEEWQTQETIVDSHLEEELVSARFGIAWDALVFELNYAHLKQILDYTRTVIDRIEGPDPFESTTIYRTDDELKSNMFGLAAYLGLADLQLTRADSTLSTLTGKTDQSYWEAVLRAQPLRWLELELGNRFYDNSAIDDQLTWLLCIKAALAGNATGIISYGKDGNETTFNLGIYARKTTKTTDKSLPSLEEIFRSKGEPETERDYVDNFPGILRATARDWTLLQFQRETAMRQCLEQIMPDCKYALIGGKYITAPGETLTWASLGINTGKDTFLTLTGTDKDKWSAIAEFGFGLGNGLRARIGAGIDPDIIIVGVSGKY